MNRMFKTLPIGSVKDILDSVFDKKETSSIKELEDVLSKKFIPSQFLDFQNEPDALTDVLYSKDLNGNYKFPMDKWRINNPKEHTGQIGDQINLEHKEDLKTHVSYVIGNLGRFLRRNQNEDMMKLTALFHDVGKKYTAVTQKDKKLPNDPGYMVDGKITGQLAFPEHEKLSAYIAAREFHKLGIPKEEAEPYIAAIYYHNKERGGWEKSEKRFGYEYQIDEKENFIKLYGDEAYNILLSLSAADRGFSSNRDINNNQHRVLKGQKIIVEELDPFIIDITDRKPKTVEEIDKKYYAESQSDEFELDARETMLREQREQQEKQLKEKHHKEYEEIMRQEAILVEEQRQFEQRELQRVSDLGALLAVASFKSKTHNRSKQYENDIDLLDLDREEDEYIEKQDFELEL